VSRAGYDCVRMLTVALISQYPGSREGSASAFSSMCRPSARATTVAPRSFRYHSRQMPPDESDRLGPKGHIFVELVREQWRAPLERATARRALLTGAFGAALVGLGSAGVALAYGEAVLLIGLGLLGIFTSLPEIRLLQAEFTDARRIGWVEPTLDDSRVIVGDPATFRVVLHARHALTLRNASLHAEARKWNDSRGAEMVATIPMSVPNAHGSINAGADWRQAVTFRVPSSAPASFYSADESVRWTITLQMTFDGASPWTRTWPMLVFPADAA
jgi:hypothetical protein